MRLFSRKFLTPVFLTRSIKTKNSENEQKEEKKQNFVVVRPSPNEYEEVLALMRQSFYPDEPLVRSLCLQPNPVVDGETCKKISEGYSLVAKCKFNGDFLGACINETQHCWEPDQMDRFACQLQCEDLKKLYHFLSYIAREPNLWQKYHIHKIFSLAVLFVRKDKRRCGIAELLLQKSRQLAADCAFQLVRVDATSAHGNDSKAKNIIITRPTLCEFADVIKLSHRSYYPNEPLINSLGLKPNKVRDDIFLKMLHVGYSFVAKCKYNGDILGACINASSQCWAPDKLDQMACEAECKKLKHLLHFYAYMSRTPNLWQKYNVYSIFSIEDIFVRRDQRGSGIGRLLLERSRLLGADCAYSLIKIDATSHYTAMLCEKMKMKLVHEIPYCTYVGEDQKPIFNPPAPHKSVKIYVDEQPQKNAMKYTLE